MDTIARSLRHAFQGLLKSRTLTLVAIATLALGIGANTAVFSFSDSVLRRPYPFDEVERIVTVWSVRPQGGTMAHTRSTSGSLATVTVPDYLEWQGQSQNFEHLAAWQFREFTVMGPDGPEWEQGAMASPAFFDVLRVKPLYGRGFLPEESEPGRDQVVVLCHALWKRRFNSDPNIVGQTIPLDSSGRYTVVGVMPPELDNTYPGYAIRLFTPLAFTEKQRGVRERRPLYVVGRLKDGVTLDQAQAQLATVAARIGEEHPETSKGWGVALVTLPSSFAGYMKPFGALFQGAAAFVLLIGCANLANLLLARATGQQRQIALRAALGASRWHIARQLLVECTLLSVAGGVLALALAYYGVELIRKAVPEYIAWFIPGWLGITMSGRAFLFATAVALLTSFALALFPALQASRVDLVDALKEGGSSASQGRGRRRLREVLVVSEVALALVLLVGSGLMVRGMMNVADMMEEHEPRGVLITRVTFPEQRYPTTQQIVDFYGRVLEGAKALPDVEAATFANNVPGSIRGLATGTVVLESQRGLTMAQRPLSDFASVGGDYFRAMRIPVIKGRALSDEDGPDAPRVAVVNQEAAQRLWPGEDPIGRRLQSERWYQLANPREGEPWVTVVGVVGNVKQYWIDKQARPAIYFPMQQSPRREMSLVLRVAGGDPKRAAPAARQLVMSVDPSRAPYGTRTLMEIMDAGLAMPRVFAGLMMLLGVLAVLLSAVGVYGLIAYHVAQRTQEVAIRMAVGAPRGAVMRLILGEVSRLLAVGMAIGLVGALAASAAMRRALWNIPPVSVAGLVVAILGLSLVGLLAGYLPARRATSVDPWLTLRYE